MPTSRLIWKEMRAFRQALTDSGLPVTQDPDEAFFVGRKEVVDWINATLSINIAKIEDTASGAIACPPRQ